MKKQKGNEEIRVLTKISGGTSYALVIPMKFVKKLGWRDRQKLVLRLFGDRITIHDWEPGK